MIGLVIIALAAGFMLGFVVGIMGAIKHYEHWMRERGQR